MKTYKIALAISVAVPTILVAGTTSALAESEMVTGQPDTVCSEKTGSTNSVMLSNSSKNGGYQCAYNDESGKKSLSPWQTKNWSSTSPQGYTSEAKCHGDNASNITWANGTFGGASTGMTESFQPTNWNTTTKNFGAAVLWSTADYENTSIKSSQYDTDCGSARGQLHIARLYPATIQMVGENEGSAGKATTYTITVNGKAYGGSETATGKVVLMVATGSAPALAVPPDIPIGVGELVGGTAKITTSFKYVDRLGVAQDLPNGPNLLYAIYEGTESDTPALPSVGWTPMVTDTLTVTLDNPRRGTSSPTARRVMRVGRPISSSVIPPPFIPFTGPMGTSLVEGNSTGGRLFLQCPAGGVPTQINLLSSSSAVSMEDIHLRSSGRDGAWIDAPDGADTDMQLICRKSDAGVQRLGQVAYGSALADSIAAKPGRTRSVYAGLGADTIVLKAKGATADGGVGADEITVKARDGVAYGSFGRDTLRATTGERTLLIGGPGPDTFYGGPGMTIINARDGMPGDVINCASKKNLVLADKGDVINGPCTIK